jgi:hypothetical protein
MAESGNSSVSKKLMWMMIGLFAGMAVLLGGGLFMAGRVVRSMGLAASTPKDTVKTPVGSFRLQKAGQVGPGLPVYPRSSLELPGENAAAEAIKDREAGRNNVFYHTTDAREAVDSWYSQHLSPQFTRHDASEKPMLEILQKARVAETDIVFVAEHGSQARIVALSEDSGGTKISLIHFENAEPAAAPSTP